MTGCACCGRPSDHVETHHRNERQSDNQPDNLTPRDRRCHMAHHENDRAVDTLTEQRFGPQSTPRGPPRPSTPRF